jgi:hypothetical protein
VKFAPRRVMEKFCRALYSQISGSKMCADVRA